MPEPTYHLRLYVAAGAPNSTRAVESVVRLCMERLAGRYELDVVDVFREPERARRDRIRGIPTLVRLAPGPERRLVGDLGDEPKLCSAILGPPR